MAPGFVRDWHTPCESRGSCRFVPSPATGCGNGFQPGEFDLGRIFRFRQPGRVAAAGLVVAYLGCLGLGLYEITAKSPALLGAPAPGWWATVRAERTTRWNPPTGFLPLDKVLHESEEAIRFYRILVRPAESRSPASIAVS